ncbi:hypothetical protein [Streptomyces flavofungini]|nr:hypothetical protein [Streptomyces flavofungini]WJV51871.1 hypothetical protein QUY26_40565 [Streptomyces flavofungini]
MNEFERRNFELDEELYARIAAGEPVDVEAAIMDNHLKASANDDDTGR